MVYRYSYNWNLNYINKREKLNQLFGGIEKDIEKIFLNLDKTSLNKLFEKYREKYGKNSEKYARKTYTKWQRNQVKLSGQTAERLLELVPHFIDIETRFELIKKLKKHCEKPTNIEIELKSFEWKEKLLPYINTFIEKSKSYCEPKELINKATWLADGDSKLVKKILYQIEIIETKQRTLYLESEFNHIEQLLSNINHLESINHTLVLPQGKITLTIHKNENKISSKVVKMTESNNKKNLITKEVKKNMLPDLNFEDLTEIQKNKLKNKIYNEKLNLEIERAKSEENFINSTKDMNRTIETLKGIEQNCKGGYEIKANYKTASGHTEVKIKKMISNLF